MLIILFDISLVDTCLPGFYEVMRLWGLNMSNITYVRMVSQHNTLLPCTPKHLLLACEYQNKLAPYECTREEVKSKLQDHSRQDLDTWISGDFTFIVASL